MAGLVRSKSCGLLGLTELNHVPPTPSPFFYRTRTNDHESSYQEEEEFTGEDGCHGDPIATTPLISPKSRFGGSQGRKSNTTSKDNNQFPLMDVLAALLRKSLVTCSVDTDDVSSMDISLPTEVRHISHVTFDPFNGFLGLPTELQPEVPTRIPSASVFGVSVESMQCSYDGRGNILPTILLVMQSRLYAEGGLKAEGIFRINAENSQEEYVRDMLNKGVVPRGIDVHCLAGLIKAWLRELPSGVLDSLTPAQVMHCNTEDECVQLQKLLPSTEAALLDWAINLMADVVQHEQYNKMNARNIAMVFAPNMTQMADPLTALIHAVQVMNFLKTLILKTIREREESAAKDWLLVPSSDCPTSKTDIHSATINSGASHGQALDTCVSKEPATTKFMRVATLSRLEHLPEEKLWSFRNSDREHEFESISGNGILNECKAGSVETECRGGYDNGDRLSLRNGVRWLCRHPIFQLSKPIKKTRNLGIVNTRGGEW
ncbi:ROP guanosine triphosphatase (GTPase)-activating protein 3 [Hibiscus trionum]|uniref:ROP guanosine triphosphatase (GTPase)-activating protein 3 n=1 Tax=Hibiscus trionum TaxID=183268 RepID=A0A9W7IRW8_HIBTR|nr:ROP guanosine triphosphatase (GTPase)-activating protein 3 [Hibiscus trionum]